jgi:hypothetical protein
MKKLSFIMAVLMILMCMPIMAISAAEEVVAPDANAPETVTNTTASVGADYVLYQYASDEEAIADGAIGRFTKEGGNGYAKSFAPVGAEAGVCGTDVFYLIADFVWADGNKRIGDQFPLHLGAGGRKVIIDGSLGQLTATKSNFKLQNTGRVIHLGYASPGQLTLRNLDVVTSTNSAIQCNAGSPTLVLENVKVSASGNASQAIVMGSTLVVKNSEIVIASSSGTAAAIQTHNAAANITLEDSTIVGNGYALYLNSGAKCSITNCDITVGSDSRAAVQCNGGVQEVSIYSGTFTGGYGFVMNTSVGEGSVYNIYGGTFIARKNSGVRFQSNNNVTMNIYGGSFKTVSHILDIATTGNPATKGTLDVNISGGTFQASAGQAIYVNNLNPNEINISGGTFISDGQRMIRLTNANSAGSTLNISGGTFLARNFDIGMDKFSGTPTPQSGLIFAECNHKINITGGTFTAYKDNGITFATDAAFVYCWNSDTTKYNPSVTISGGSFKGGLCFLADVVYTGDKNAPIDEAKSTFYYYTEGTDGVALEPKAVQGASVRLDKNSSGLRFTATIDALAIKFIEENLVKEGTELSYGTMIVPSNYVKYAGGELTMEAFDKAGKAYLNIEAKDGVIVNEDGSVTINAAMVNIKKENYDRDFIAVAYIKYTDKTGAEVIKYATNVTLAAFSRNVQEVAHAALADVLTTSAGTYTNKVDGYYVWNQNARKYELTPGTAYSRYNAEQLAVLKSYIIAE